MDTSIYAPSAFVLQWHRGTFALTVEYALQVAVQLAPLLAAAVILVSTLYIWSCCICFNCKPAMHETRPSRLKLAWAVVAMIITAAASAVFVFYGLANSVEQHTALLRATDIIAALVGWPEAVAADVTSATGASAAYEAAVNNAFERFNCDMVGNSGGYVGGGDYTAKICADFTGNIDIGDGNGPNTPFQPYADGVLNAVGSAVDGFNDAAAGVNTAVSGLDLSALSPIASTITEINAYRETGVGLTLWGLLGLMVLMVLMTAANAYRGHKRGKIMAEAEAEAEVEATAAEATSGARRSSLQLAAAIMDASPRKPSNVSAAASDGDEAEGTPKEQFERSCAGAWFYTSVVTLFMLVFLIAWVVAVALGAATFATADVCADPDPVFLDISGYGADPQMVYFITCDEGGVVDPNAADKAALDSNFQDLDDQTTDVACILRDPASTELCLGPTPAGQNTANSNGDAQLIAMVAAFDDLYTKSGAKQDPTSTDPRVGLMAGLECFGASSLNALYQAVLNWLCGDVFNPVGVLAALMIGLGCTIFILDCSRRISRPPRPGHYRPCCGWREKRRVGIAPEPEDGPSDVDAARRKTEEELAF